MWLLPLAFITRSSFVAHHSLRGKQKRWDDSLARQGRAGERASEWEDEEEPRRRGPRRDRQKDRVGEQGSEHLLPLPTARLGHISDTLSLPASLRLPLSPPLSHSLSSSGRFCCGFSSRLISQAAAAKRAV